MHAAAPPRKTVAPQSAGQGPDGAPARLPSLLPLLALLGGNVALAFGPWFVRVADTGPVASGFWRITLATPLLVAAALASGWRPTQRDGGMSRGLWWVIALGGVCFAADLGAWHLGILRTTLANATLFGNSATLMFRSTVSSPRAPGRRACKRSRLPWRRQVLRC